MAALDKTLQFLMFCKHIGRGGKTPTPTVILLRNSTGNRLATYFLRSWITLSDLRRTAALLTSTCTCAWRTSLQQLTCAERHNFVYLRVDLNELNT